MEEIINKQLYLFCLPIKFWKLNNSRVSKINTDFNFRYYSTRLTKQYCGFILMEFLSRCNLLIPRGFTSERHNYAELNAAEHNHRLQYAALTGIKDYILGLLTAENNEIWKERKLIDLHLNEVYQSIISHCSTWENDFNLNPWRTSGIGLGNFLRVAANFERIKLIELYCIHWLSSRKRNTFYFICCASIVVLFFNVYSVYYRIWWRL